ncbi:hypothetical protein EFY79_15620 [Hanamia caeni]|jgi:uncharacterized protein (DUF486 family)|uniref:2TM domain-containing protein n=2 Tax=Hanamia caeni TaxID=2294116 RepID=A0A3M9N9Y4_9BACT|nr:hypothetical protein EFY79_15620 [Hanamia caeni]
MRFEVFGLFIIKPKIKIMEKEIKDPELWKRAQKRAAFKYHVLIYFIMNIFFWTVWYLSLKNTPSPITHIEKIPWPVWPMVGWGIGIFFHYVAAYKNQNSLAEKEYNKLKNNNN